MSSVSLPARRTAAADVPPGTPSAAPARTARVPMDIKVVATFLVRFYANGKVSIEMRPNLPKPRRDASPR